MKQKSFSVLDKFFMKLKMKKFNSSDYWENRYRAGGDSGAGSYGRLAEFKADIINSFCKKNRIKQVVELGCGDGNNLSLFKIQKYIGLDVSKTSIKRCVEIFKKDKTKSFFLYGNNLFLDNLEILKSDLSLSLDVLYHLIEDEAYYSYLNDLFKMSKKYVIIYSSNFEKKYNNFKVQHVKHREFTKDVERLFPKWKLKEKIKNKYPLRGDKGKESFANFYIYEKIK